MAVGSVASSSSTHLINHLFRHPKPPPFTNGPCFLLRSFCTFVNHNESHSHKAQYKTSPHSGAFTSASPLSHLVSSRSLSSLRLSSVSAESLSSVEELTEKEEIEGESEEDRDEGPLNVLLDEGQESGGVEERISESDDDEVRDNGEDLKPSDGDKSKESSQSATKAPSLTVKEKKELASYAHSLGKKLKCQLVGKSGVTNTVILSFLETLEKNELLKVKIHRTCPGELEDVVKHLEEATGSVVVGQIGRTVIVYRPSLTKLKKEEKRKQAQKIFLRRASKFRLAPTNKEASVLSGRGRRGASRV